MAPLIPDAMVDLELPDGEQVDRKRIGGIGRIREIRIKQGREGGGKKKGRNNVK